MFRDPGDFPFVPRLEAALDTILDEVRALAPEEFAPSPDSLTTVRDGYDETGWRYIDLHGGTATEATRARCPRTAAACAAVPGMRNAGLSLFGPGTHLYPHRGELPGVLRCHLPLIVPAGDQGLAGAGHSRAWRAGQCLVFDDTVEHEAWNRTAGDRVVLIITFAAP